MALTLHGHLEQMSRSKVTLTEEKETLLITLFAKAEESKDPDSILADRFAADVVEQIEYDFSKIRVNRDTRIGLALRAKVLDDWARDFISKNPTATVLNIGCGLDSRVFRIDPPATVNWFDVDYPEVIELRTQFYPHRQSGHSNIGTSVTEPTWLEQVNVSGPVMVIAEGLLYYLSHAEVEHLFQRVLQHFATGEITFDVYSSLGVRIVNANAAIRATGANLRWSIEHPREMEQKIKRLQLIDEYNAYDSEHSSRMSIWFRFMLSTIGRTQPFRKLVRLLRYKF
jgi:O-methyltransferase involved in polyketide biosynthesis